MLTQNRLQHQKQAHKRGIIQLHTSFGHTFGHFYSQVVIYRQAALFMFCILCT